MDSRKFVKSFSYALVGIKTALQEQNMRFHLLSAAAVIFVGLWTGLTRIEWAIVVIVIAIMLMAEMFNTAIERVVDLASPDIHPLAKQAKDVAAGAVLVFAVASVIIGLLIFLPKWANFF